MKTICIFLFPFYCLFGQNLISNFDFNNEGGWESLNCRNYDRATIWKNVDDKQRNIYRQFENYIGDPNIGRLFYTPNCNCLHEGDYIGCANYFYQKFQSPLEIGTIYKVSFKVLFLRMYEVQESEALKHVGVLLSNKKAYFNTGYDIVEKNAITLNTDDLSYHKWIETEVFIIPTCELNYITIGLFKEKNWIPSGEKTVNLLTYFVDDISVEPIKEMHGKVYKAEYYCNETIKTNEINSSNVLPTFNFYYESNSYQVKNQTDLDDFAKYASINKNQILYVTGHTDNKGSDNYELSKKRVDSLVDYLTQTYKIEHYRFIKGYFSDNLPVASNNTEQGRALNRRVSIEAIDFKKANACYREALNIFKESGNTEETFKMLFCWGLNEIDSEKILIFFDPTWGRLKHNPQWGKIYKLVQDSYNQYSKASYAFLLDSLYCEDQKYRRLASYVQDLGGYFRAIDTSRWSFPKISVEEWNARDSLIHKHLLSLINKYGYPKISEVGERSAKSAAVIMIHRSDRDELRNYLPIFEKLCKEGEGDWAYYATMYDKLCVLEEIPQRYGTQFIQNDKNTSVLIRYKTEGREIVNEQRRKIALIPLSEEEFNITLRNSN